MSTDLRSANLCGGASENRGAFLFFLENPSKKNYTDGIFKKRLLRKNGPFPVLGGKNFFCGGARGRAALECAECLQGVPGGFGVRVDGRSWASVDGRDGGCACLI